MADGGWASGHLRSLVPRRRVRSRRVGHGEENKTKGVGAVPRLKEALLMDSFFFSFGAVGV